VPRRGDVWFADVPGDKHRPVLILSRDPMGQILHSVICAPITSTIRGLTTEVALGSDAGLVHRSVANFDNTFLLARRRLIRRLGRASRAAMEASCVAMATAVGCSFLHVQSVKAE
jgi:mRNA interferase MazF